MQSIDLNIQEMKAMFDKALQEEQIQFVQENLANLRNIYKQYSLELKNKAHINGSGIFLEEDKLLKKINIDEVVLNHFLNSKNIFGFYLWDEIAIIKYNLNKNSMIPIYYYSLEEYKILHLNNYQDIYKLKINLNKNLQFFYDNLQDYNLLEGEGIISKDHDGEAFDIVIKFQDYLICYNNTENSLETQEKNFNLERNKILQDASRLYSKIRNAYSQTLS